MSALPKDVHVSDLVKPTIAHFPDVVVVLNDTDEIIDWNQSAKQLYGWSKEEVIHKSYIKFLETSVIGNGLNFEKLKEIYLEKNKSWHGKLIHTNKYGDRIITYSNIYVFYNQLSTSKHFIIISKQTSLSSSQIQEPSSDIRQTEDYFEEDLLAHLINEGSTIEDLNHFYSFIIEAFLQYYSLDAGALYSYKGFQDEFFLIQSEFIPLQIQKSLDLYPAELFPMHDVLAGKSAVFTAAIHKKLPSTHPLCIFESLIAIPISVGNQLLGVFVGLNKKSRIPKPHNPGRIQLISQQTGLLLSRLQEKVKNDLLNDELELYIQKRTYDLTIANQQLKKYASHIAHDLREPARMVFAYLELFHTKASSNIPEEALEFLHYALDGAERMKALLEGIWEYTKITSQDRNHASVDTTMLLDKVKAHMAPILSESETQLKYENLPEIEGDKVLLFQLLQTLINKMIIFSYNECKFIEIGIKQSNRFWSFKISIDGIELPLDQVQRIEQVFSRGYHVKALPTLDLDLSICKGIVEKHGGIIGIESNPEYGTQIYFTIKKYEEIQKRMMEVKSVKT